MLSRDAKPMDTRKRVTWNSIQTEHGNGSWAVVDRRLIVRTEVGTKTMDPGKVPPEFLVADLMRELWETVRARDVTVH